jgi:hypothetical protein
MTLMTAPSSGASSMISNMVRSFRLSGFQVSGAGACGFGVCRSTRDERFPLLWLLVAWFDGSRFHSDVDLVS